MKRRDFILLGLAATVILPAITPAKTSREEMEKLLIELAKEYGESSTEDRASMIKELKTFGQQSNSRIKEYIDRYAAALVEGYGI